jgi:hypothetical protein
MNKIEVAMAWVLTLIAVVCIMYLTAVLIGY